MVSAFTIHKMKIAFALILLAILGKLNAQVIEFKLYACESSSLIQIKGDSLHFENLMFEPRILDTLIDEFDEAQLQLQFEMILKKRKDEVWLNACIDDGTNLKFIIKKEGFSKKVFVGNYFDRRLNEIALIINKYLLKIKSRYIVSIPYGMTDKESIREEIKSQKRGKEAPSEYKEHMLNTWCEPYK